MKKLLHVIASPRQERSHTLEVSREFLKIFQKTHPEYLLDELNLYTEHLCSLSAKSVSGKYMLLEGKYLFGSLKEDWNEILQQIHRFLSSDFYLFSTPMWNFSIPYRLKHYLDLIIQPSYLFHYTPQGVEGLVKNKKALVIMTTGGRYDSPELSSNDFLEPYLRHLFRFIGITDVSFVKGEGMDSGSQQEREARLHKAIKEAQELAMQT